MTDINDVIGKYRYADPELCKDWANNIPLEVFNPDFLMLTDSQDLDALCDYFPVLPRDEITGAIVTVLDGDYGEVYVTEYCRPYDLSSIYHPIDYYL